VTGRCDLCDSDQPVSIQIVRFVLRGEERSRYFDTVRRCDDRRACRARVEAAGGEWLVDDPEPFGR